MEHADRTTYCVQHQGYAYQVFRTPLAYERLFSILRNVFFFCFLAQAIRKARQRRRPGSVVYGDQDTYQNVKALTDERTAGGFLEKDFQDLPDAGDMSSGASQGGGTTVHKSGA